MSSTDNVKEANLNYDVFHVLFCSRGDTTITTRLHTRKFGQAPILSQVLSSHPHVFVMILWDSMNFHSVKQLFQIAGAGDRTADPWVTSSTLSPYTTGTSLDVFHECPPNQNKIHTFFLVCR